MAGGPSAAACQAGLSHSSRGRKSNDCSRMPSSWPLAAASIIPSDAGRPEKLVWKPITRGRPAGAAGGVVLGLDAVELLVHVEHPAQVLAHASAWRVGGRAGDDRDRTPRPVRTRPGRARAGGSPASPARPPRRRHGGPRGRPGWRAAGGTTRRPASRALMRMRTSPSWSTYSNPCGPQPSSTGVGSTSSRRTSPPVPGRTVDGGRALTGASHRRPDAAAPQLELGDQGLEVLVDRRRIGPVRRQRLDELQPAQVQPHLVALLVARQVDAGRPDDDGQHRRGVEDDGRCSIVIAMSERSPTRSDSGEQHGAASGSPRVSTGSRGASDRFVDRRPVVPLGLTTLARSGHR